MEIATKFQLGDVVYHASSRSDKESQQCPDCLGSGKWPITSPGGESYDYECPRCHGRGELSQQSFAPEVRRLTIGQVRTCTPPRDHDKAVEYMCTETGVGSGSVYNEGQLFADEETAKKVAEVAAIKANQHLEERDAKRQEWRILNTYRLNDAKVKEAEQKEFDTRCRLERLLEHICELDPHISRGIGRYEDKEPKYATLDEKVVEILQEHLVWLDEKSCDYLDEWRESDKECRC